MSAAVDRPGAPGDRLRTGEPLLVVRDVARSFDVSAPWLNRVLERKPRTLLHAVDGVSLAIEHGETLGLVGESGCGKSTVARLIVGLYAPTRGSIRFDGTVLAGEGAGDLAGGAAHRASGHADDLPGPLCQPQPALAGGRHRGRADTRTVAGHAGAELAARVVTLLQQVGLAAGDRGKYPHQFSGGQRQRISIARALCDRAALPGLRRADVGARRVGAGAGAEPDERLQRRIGLSLPVHLARPGGRPARVDRVGVMYLGRIVELAPTRRSVRRAAAPVHAGAARDDPRPARAGRARAAIPGEVPSALEPPPGCAFHPRCPLAEPRCRREAPALLPFAGGGEVACHAVAEARLAAPTVDVRLAAAAGSRTVPDPL